jgi:hypothetical protein
MKQRYNLPSAANSRCIEGLCNTVLEFRSYERASPIARDRPALVNDHIKPKYRRSRSNPHVDWIHDVIVHGHYAKLSRVTRALPFSHHFTTNISSFKFDITTYQRTFLRLFSRATTLQNLASTRAGRHRSQPHQPSSTTKATTSKHRRQLLAIVTHTLPLLRSRYHHQRPPTSSIRPPSPPRTRCRPDYQFDHHL